MYILVICRYLMYNHDTNDHGIISVFVKSLTVVSEVVHTHYGLINKCVLQ